MYSTKKNIRLLLAVMLQHEVPYWVLCPGSRNAPITLTATRVWGDGIANQRGTLSVLDERTAGFVALGLSDGCNAPVAVCCTSGSAVLNLAPAVAEAYYRHVNLVVISADRPKRWIGQMDGQTLPQDDVFGGLVCKSVTLPEEIATEEDEWYCRRLVEEAFMEAVKQGGGPIHINVPLSEPLFEETDEPLPIVTPVKYYNSYGRLRLPAHDTFIRKWTMPQTRRMIVIGQRAYDKMHVEEWNALSRIVEDKSTVVVAEHLANVIQKEDIITRADEILDIWPEDEALMPECVITLGGHVVSKRLKQFLRKASADMQHLHVSLRGDYCDTFRHLTGVVQADNESFVSELSDWYLKRNDGRYEESTFRAEWHRRQQEVKAKASVYDYHTHSDLKVLADVIKMLPEKSRIHLANSSMVRNVQLFDFPNGCLFYCNRGMNGIEGSVSTAVGYAIATPEEKSYLLVGDLSFAYDSNALWNINLPPNLRILVLNNGGGQIFRQLPGLQPTSECRRMVAGEHRLRISNERSMKCRYLSAQERYLKAFYKKELERWADSSQDIPLLEIETKAEQNDQVVRERREWMYTLRDRSEEKR